MNALDAWAVWELAVLWGGLGLLTWLVIRGQSVFLAAPISALAILVASGADPLTGLTGSFMRGFAGYLEQFYLIFVLGAAFGRLVDRSGAAVAVAGAVTRWLGPQRACLAVVLACAVLTYGGVSLFVVGFAVYPLAIELFRAANLPRRFIPAAIAFGSITFTMTSAGSPEIQNLIPIKYLVDAAGRPLSDARAGWQVSLIVAGLMFVLGQLYLEWAIARDLRRGARFEDRPDDRPAEPLALQPQQRRPGLARALLPLVVTLAMLNAIPPLARTLAGPPPLEAATIADVPDDSPPNPGPADTEPAWRAWLRAFPEDPTLAIFAGVVVAWLALSRFVGHPSRALGDGFIDGLVAIGATSSVVGFGSALKGLPAFERTVDWVTHLPMEPLLGAALAVAVICGIAGSASGGQGLAWPIIKPIYVDELGVAPRALHRVVAIASGSLDSLPANGYLVTLIRNICGDTHARAYGPVFVLTVLIPLLGTGLAVTLFRWVPAWSQG